MTLNSYKSKHYGRKDKSDQNVIHSETAKQQLHTRIYQRNTQIIQGHTTSNKHTKIRIRRAKHNRSTQQVPY
jgi:hypothetical protein